MGFNTSGAASGAAAGSSFGPWGAAIGGLAGGFLSPDNQAVQLPTPPTLASPVTPGAVSGQYGQSYIDPVTGKVTYTSSTGNLSSTSLGNQDLQSKLMGYGGTNYDQLIAQQQAKINSLSPARGWAAYGPSTSPGSGVPIPQLKDFFPQGVDPMFNTLSKDKLDAINQNYQNAMKTYQGNADSSNAALIDANNYLDTLNQAKSQAAKPNAMLDYLDHGPDNANYLQGEVTKQFQNAQLANQNANASRGMGSSSMSEIGNAGNAQNLALGILGAQNQAGQQNYTNRNTMLNYLSGQNQQDLSAEQMRGSLNNQQMGQGQQVGMNQSGLQTQQGVAQAGLNWQGSMANANQQQTQNMQNQNNFGSAMGALGNAAGQYNSSQQMQNWLNNQNQVNGTPGSAGTAYGNWMANNAGHYGG